VELRHGPYLVAGRRSFVVIASEDFGGKPDDSQTEGNGTVD
jgi:hypothetical protein